MGFSSFECRGCGRSLISVYAMTAGVNDWMVPAVALFPGGGMAVGDYDGYGRIEGYELYTRKVEPECWHKACWEVAGKPEYAKSSDYARDQGYFFDEKDYCLPDPRMVGKLPEKLKPEHSMLGGSV